MKQVLVCVGLFFLQLYLTFSGTSIFGKFLNPIFLFATSIAIPIYLIRTHLQPSSAPVTMAITSIWKRMLWALGGLLSVLVAYEEVRKAFVKFSDPIQWSDVIPQVQTLYDRFANGELPYAPIDFVGYTLQPIYMPLHWLPDGLAVLFQIDPRWIGFWFFAIAVGVYGWFLAIQPYSIWGRIVALLLPSVPLWAYIEWGPADLSVSYEIIIGAYYLILASGLLIRNLWLVTIGIVLCLLSRYTFLFWLPLFALLLLYEKGWKKSLFVWGTVVVCFVFIYIIPFYLKDPTMLDRGLSYYVGATVAEWNGYGDPPVSWTHENGISFAPIMKAAFSGDMAHRVHWTRMIQGTMLLLLFIASLWAYRRWRDRIDLYTFSLVGLYTFLTVYYFFAPLTYRYYLFSWLVVSAVLCGKVIMHSFHFQDKKA